MQGSGKTRNDGNETEMEMEIERTLIAGTYVHYDLHSIPLRSRFSK